MLKSIPIPYRADVSAYFEALRGLAWPAWLDSAGMGRYDILTAAPCDTKVWSAAARQENWGALRKALGNEVAGVPGVPFAGGVLGYWGYDCCELAHEVIPSATPPLAAFGVYDWALQVDHFKREAALVSWCRVPATLHLLEEVRERLQHIRSPDQGCFQVSGRISTNFPRERYEEAFKKIQDYLYEGDCYQVNLAQRFCAQAEGDAYVAYLKLRSISPAPYSAFLDFPGAQILSASPERFLRVEQGRVETRPIKGTRRRRADPAEDARMCEELRTHPKDRAENLMIVDLLRNDLGRCCVPGSVHVPALFEIESYAQVHHLVSTVQGQLLPDAKAQDVLQACFPGGSITGAPKRRAMEIIRQLEPHAREVYCGAIGYIGFDGQMDTNIAIRTMVYSHNEIRAWAGGGIVVDSQCGAEYQETLDKASAMLQVLQSFGGQWCG